MGNPEKNESKGFFAAMASGLSVFGNAMHRSVNGYGLCIIIILGLCYFIPFQVNCLVCVSMVFI